MGEEVQLLAKGERVDINLSQKMDTYKPETNTASIHSATSDLMATKAKALNQESSFDLSFFYPYSCTVIGEFSIFLAVAAFAFTIDHKRKSAYWEHGMLGCKGFISRSQLM